MPIPVVLSDFGIPVRAVEGHAPVMQVASSGIPIRISDRGVPFVVLGLEPTPISPLQEFYDSGTIGIHLRSDGATPPGGPVTAIANEGGSGPAFNAAVVGAPIPLTGLFFAASALTGYAQTANNADLVGVRLTWVMSQSVGNASYRFFGRAGMTGITPFFLVRTVNGTGLQLISNATGSNTTVSISNIMTASTDARLFEMQMTPTQVQVWVNGALVGTQTHPWGAYLIDRVAQGDNNSQPFEGRMGDVLGVLTGRGDTEAAIAATRYYLDQRFELGLGFPNPRPAPQPYLGAVATGAAIPTSSATSQRQANSRSHHVARENISGLRIELPAWWWQRNSNQAGTQYQERDAGGPITYTASIEYPAGTFTQVLFGGSTSGVAAGGSALLSDLTPVNIPNGASFWIRTFSTSSWGIVFMDGDATTTVKDFANGESYEFAPSGLTDRTMSGTVPNNPGGTNPILKPTAIVAMTTRPSFLFIGDSRVWGYGDTITPSGDMGELERLIGPQYGYINAGSSGDWLDRFLANGAKRTALQEYVSHVIVQTAINSLRQGGSGQNKTAAAVLAERQQVLALFPNKRRIVATTAPQASSSNNWSDQAGQTVNPNSAQIIAFNDAVRAGVPNAIGYIDLADAAEPSRNSGKWKTNGAARAFTSDGLHATPLGYEQVVGLPVPL